MCLCFFQLLKRQSPFWVRSLDTVTSGNACSLPAVCSSSRFLFNISTARLCSATSRALSCLQEQQDNSRGRHTWEGCSNQKPSFSRHGCKLSKWVLPYALLKQKWKKPSACCAYAVLCTAVPCTCFLARQCFLIRRPLGPVLEAYTGSK